MRLTPTPNADPMQAKMMQYMPLIFLFIYYNFSCALSLYSMTNALFTIGQQMVINRMPDEPAAVTVGPGGKLVKNVTPKKKG
jgi:YidC/Oxa1 family membrane protein insertase